MQNSHDAAFFARTAIGVVAGALLVIIACSAPSIRRIARRLSPTQKRQHQPISELYEDEDGRVTHESVAAYSYQLPRVLVLVLSIVGSLDSLILCVITTQIPYPTIGVGQWLEFGAWVRFDHF